MQHLERHAPGDGLLLLGEVDGAEPARARRAQDPVGAEPVALRQVGRTRGGGERGGSQGRALLAEQAIRLVVGGEELLDPLLQCEVASAAFLQERQA